MLPPYLRPVSVSSKRYRVRALVVLLLLVAAACAAPGEDDAPVPGDSLDLAPPDQVDYEVFLVGGLADTLRGRAHYGPVVDARTGQEVEVVRLETSFDFGGGFFISYGSTRWPAPGQYPIEPFPSDSLAGRAVPSGFSARYRRGLLINLRATGGTLELETSNDTLVAGRFEMELAGLLSMPGQTPRQGVVHARGTFRALDTGAGYILGF